MTRIGTPLSPSAFKVMMLGAGELGKEVVIELQRYGCETIAVDRYPGAPAMQVAHRSHVISMLDGAADTMMAMAASAWMDGFHASVLAGAIILGAGVVVVIVGFRGVPRPSMGHGADSSDSAPPVVAEL